MKKIITLALAAGMFAACAAPASAADIKVNGNYTFQFIQGSTDFQGNKIDRETQQVNLGITATVSENLSGYFAVRSYWDWGTNDYKGGTTGDPAGTAFDGAKLDVMARYAYVDWMIPQTVVKIRMGRQDLRLPGLANGKNPAIWSKDPVDGITISAPVTDWLGLTAFWGRYARTGAYTAENGYGVITNNTSVDRRVDAFGLVADLKFDGVKVSPFVAYASVGDDLAAGGTSSFNYNGYASGNTTKMNNQFNPAGESSIFWAGFGAQLTMFDPFVAKLGFVYGDRNYSDGASLSILGNKYGIPSQHGWLVDASVAYKTAYGTPELFAWYGSGDNAKTSMYATQGNLPSLGGRFAGSYGFYNGSKMNENELNNQHTGAGAWGVRLGMSNISFLEGLTHDIALLYAQGTNDKEMAIAGQYLYNSAAKMKSYAPNRYMTTKDSIIELDFGTTYQIYKNLSARLEVAYVWQNFKERDNGWFALREKDYDDAWKAALQLQYKF